MQPVPPWPELASPFIPAPCPASWSCLDLLKAQAQSGHVTANPWSISAQLLLEWVQQSPSLDAEAMTSSGGSHLQSQHS